MTTLAGCAVLGVWFGRSGYLTSHTFTSWVCGAVLVMVGVLWITCAARRGSRCTVRPRDLHPVRLSIGSLLVGGLVVGLAGAWRSVEEWQAVDRAVLGTYEGEATVIGEAQSIGRGTRIVVAIDGQRFESWVFGSRRHRVQMLAAGDVIRVSGLRRELTGDHRQRIQLRHIVGRFEMSEMGSVSDARSRTSMLMRAANRLRHSLSEGARHLPEDRAALFTGLVYGDDSEQTPETVAHFRSSGLAHLTAVSGQNVVFVLTMAAPVLTRLARPMRLGVTVLLLGWFALLTRLEPSVIRAVIMAAVSATMLAVGRPVSSWIVLCSTVGIAVLVDPFLVWSVGWWLSVAGCVGLILWTPAVAAVLRRWSTGLATWVAPTLAAQTGVLGVIVAVFGWPSAVAVPCNVLAAPVAGVVMLLGLPGALVASAVPPGLASVIMWPIGLGVAWVESVAMWGARLDPPAGLDVAVALLVACGVLTMWATSRSPDGRSRTGDSTAEPMAVGVWRGDGLPLQGN